MSSRQQATDEVRRTRKPAEMSRTQWRSVRRVLMVVAKHYPTATPSVARIADQAKLSAVQTRRILYIAEAAGLLAIVHDAGSGKHCINKTSRYHIVALMQDDCPLISGEEMREEGTPSEYSLPSVVSPPQSNQGPRFARSVAAATRRTFEEPSRQVGDVAAETPQPEVWEMGDAVALANESGRRERRVFQRNPGWTDTTALVRYFAAEWKFFVEKNPLWHEYRPFDSRGEAGKYIKDTFLAPSEGIVFSVEEVKQMIDQFFLDLGSYQNKIKTGQSAWRRFSATWKPSGGVSQQLDKEWWK